MDNTGILFTKQDAYLPKKVELCEWKSGKLSTVNFNTADLPEILKDPLVICLEPAKRMPLQKEP